MLEADGVGEVSVDFSLHELEFVRRAFREVVGKTGEQLIELLLTVCVGDRTEEGDRIPF